MKVWSPAGCRPFICTERGAACDDLECNGDDDDDDIDDVDDNDNDTFANLPSQMLGDQSLVKQQGLQGGTFSFFTLLQRIGWR